MITGAHETILGCFLSKNVLSESAKLTFTLCRINKYLIFKILNYYKRLGLFCTSELM